jgi:hypothetical protein
MPGPDLDIRCLTRLALGGGILVAVIAWGVFIPLKRAGLLPGHWSWTKVIVAPIVGPLMFIGPILCERERLRRGLADGSPGSVLLQLICWGSILLLIGVAMLIDHWFPG